MVFKVKQRGQTMYADMITSQVDQPSNQKQFSKSQTNEYPLKFNWPYDYVSIVETINFDVDVKYDRMQMKALKTNAMEDIGKQNRVLSKEERAKMPFELDKKQTAKSVTDKNKKVKAQNMKAEGSQKAIKEAATAKKVTTAKKSYGV